MLEIKNLFASINTTPILHGLTLQVNRGEKTALMGPNGSGKSTLAAILAGHPSYTVTSGDIQWSGKSILDLEPEERAALGIFLAFQYPASLPGVSVSHFLRLARNAQERAREQAVTPLAPFIKELRATMKQLEIPWEFAERSLNDGFSGGEKKRMEMLQMLILKPKLVILDEIDSGLDIDAMRIVAQAVTSLPEETTVIIITHYQRLLNYLVPDSVHVIKEGKITRSGDATLAQELEKSGYADL
jgi:Fe-S cluster assembly ATP-binding protein